MTICILFPFPLYVVHALLFKCYDFRKDIGVLTLFAVVLSGYFRIRYGALSRLLKVVIQQSCLVPYLLIHIFMYNTARRARWLPIVQQLSTHQWQYQRFYTTPTYSTSSPIRISEAEVQSARKYCSDLLQYYSRNPGYMRIISNTLPENSTPPPTPS